MDGGGNVALGRESRRVTLKNFCISYSFKRDRRPAAARLRYVPVRPKALKGVVEITPSPRFETAFVLAFHYGFMPYLSSAKACAITTGPGMCLHVSTCSPVSTMGTSASAGSVLPHQRLPAVA